MYKLSTTEISMINGADGVCLKDPPEGSESDWQSGVGGAVEGIYEGLVDATSHIIERVADAL